MKGGDNMAIVKITPATKLAIKIQTGLSASGNPVYRMRSFANVKPGATDADIHAVGIAIAALQKHTAAGIVRTDEGFLVNQ